MKPYNTAKTLAILTAIMASSCSHEDIDLYSGIPAAVYIQQINSYDIYGNPISYRQGNPEYSFADVSLDYTYAYTDFNVRLAGDIADYDRPYVLKIDPEATDAIEGIDFDISENDFTIKAGTNSDNVRVKMLRTDRLLNNTFTVTFKLEPNEYFALAITEYKNSSGWNVEGPIQDATTYYIKFGEKYTCPNYWSTWGGDYFGPFTGKKYAVLNTLMNWTAYDWRYAGFSGFKIAIGKFPFAADYMRRYLQDKADAGDPVYDEDGEYMQLADKYAVDYSKL